MSAGKKIVAVVGGTGNVGSSVAFSLHDNPEFEVCALSRDPSTAKAKRVSDKGIQVIKADSWKPEELGAAFEGAWGLFVNTDSDDPNFKRQIGPNEFEMGKTIIDTAIKSGIKHFAYAALPGAKKLTNGKLSSLGFDNKKAIADYAYEVKGFETVSIINPGWFLEDYYMDKYCAAYGGFAKVYDNEDYLTLRVPPMGNYPESVPHLAVADDYGDIVHGVFLDPQKWNGTLVHAVSESTSFQELTDIYSRVTGKRARYVRADAHGNSLQAADQYKTKEVNGLFVLMEAIEGKFFNGQVTDPANAKILKKAGAQARGKTGQDLELTTVERYYQKWDQNRPVLFQ